MHMAAHLRVSCYLLLSFRTFICIHSEDVNIQSEDHLQDYMG